VKDRWLLLTWAGVAVVSVLLLLLALGQWRSLVSQSTRARVERERLTAAIRGMEEEIVKEMRGSAALLQEMQWTSAGGDPSAFLTRLADLARGGRLRVTAIGALEQQATPQFNKTWHRIQLNGPYSEIKDLATKVESEKGILEEVVIEAPPEGGTRPDVARASGAEVTGRFKMTALELTREAKTVIERALAASASAPQAAPGGGAGALVLPLPPRAGDAVAVLRDPFTFGGTILPPPRPGAPGTRPVASRPAGTPGAEDKKAVPMELRGVVAFPGGFLAILNNQIVKVGDMVSGHRVERITEREVVVREPGAEPRTVPLPALIPTAPAEPRR